MRINRSIRHYENLTRTTFGSVFKAFAASLVVSLAAVAATAQEEISDGAPPPVKAVSPDERSRLDSKQKDMKDRTKMSIELMNLRVRSATKLAEDRDFEGMYSELGFFHGLMDDAMKYLKARDDGRGKVLDNYKRLEIALRGMAPKIEVLRRELPLRYDPYVRRLMGYLRSARANATDALFDDTVVPQRKKPQ